MGLNFLKAYTSNKVKTAISDATAALVAFDPDGATEAQLDLMEQNLNQLALKISTNERQYSEAQTAYNAANALNTKRMSIAENLSSKIEAGKAANQDVSSLENSLNTQLNTIEESQAELKDLKERADDYSSLLASLKATHKSAADKILNARKVLEQAKRGMDKAEAERERARERQETAAMAAGVHKGSDSLNVALEAMKRKTDAMQDQAHAANLNASVLTKVDHEKTDPNILAAEAEVSGAPSPAMSLSERLAALKNNKAA